MQAGNRWDRQAVKPIRGSSHLRFGIREASLRLTSKMPLTYLLEDTAFSLTEKIYFALTWDVGGETEGRGRRRAGDRITTETRSTRSCTENAGWLDLERLVARRPAAACGRRPTAQRAVRPALTAPSSPDFSVHLRALVTPRWALLRDLRLLRAPTSLSIPAAPPSSTVASVPPPRAHRSASPTRYAARSSSVA
jgi:hypothetical protein